MAKAELDILLSKLQGRLTGDSEFYVTNRHGKTVISNYPLAQKQEELSANQRATFASFGECSKRAKAELSAPPVSPIGKPGTTSTRRSPIKASAVRTVVSSATTPPPLPKTSSIPPSWLHHHPTAKKSIDQDDL